MGDAAEREKTRKTRMAGKQGQMFEASWERIDSARNPDLYEAKDGVTFLRGQQQQQQQEENTSVMQTLTEEDSVRLPPEITGWKSCEVAFRLLRNTSCARWRGRTHRTPAWRSTSAGRWRGKPGWSLRSRRSTSSLGER